MVDLDVMNQDEKSMIEVPNVLSLQKLNHWGELKSKMISEADMYRFDQELFTFCYKHEIWHICTFLHAYQYVICGQ